VLVPGVQVSKAYKKRLVEVLSRERAILATLVDLGVDPAAAGGALDRNSPSVPVLYVGSCKRGAVPYDLGASMEVELDLAGDESWRMAPVPKQLAAADLEKYNVVAELSLCAPAVYGDGRAPLVVKRPAVLKAAAVAQLSEREAAGEPASPRPGECPEELLESENSLSTLTLHNAEARHLHSLLDLLPAEYSSERAKWRDVVYALAGTSEQYKPLAVWFSRRCPEKWAAGGAAALDELWADARARQGGRLEHPLTQRSIAHWARACDPVRYAEVMERAYFTTLTSYVYDYGGSLEHYMVAKVLLAMLGAKYCVDVEPAARGERYCWYEFVLPGQKMKPGEVWKWRREAEPDDVHVYMSDKLAIVYNAIATHLEEQRQGAANEDQGRYYKGLVSAFTKSKRMIFDNRYKNGVIAQAAYLFRRRGFAESLDRRPDLFGVTNGVLRLGPRVELIDRYHEYPVSKFAPVAYTRFDPARPDAWQQLALDAIADIIVEPDARDWILYHAAQGLSGEPKEGIMLLWVGGGQNGKTSFLRWVAKALGPYADKFNIQIMCCAREDADRPNSAMMRFKWLNYAYCEESNPAQVLNPARMKEIVNAGEMSGRELNCRQETFTMKANLVAASQYSFIINTTDHGTWRRLALYTSKARFRKEPDPAVEFEKKDDQRFVRQYPDDPLFQSAFLSILAYYYERLQREHRGELKNVRSPTISRETEAFRVEQDSLHRWISLHIVLSGEERTYPLDSLGTLYAEWYAKNIDRRRLSPSETLKEIESSAIGKYLRVAPNKSLVLRGCRVLTPDSPDLLPGEALIADAGRAGPLPTFASKGGRWWLPADT
jgi:phage/plasmid-associated DNA primase